MFFEQIYSKLYIEINILIKTYEYYITLKFFFFLSHDD